MAVLRLLLDHGQDVLGRLREIARRMKERGLEVRQIAELTQLLEEEIADL